MGIGDWGMPSINELKKSINNRKDKLNNINGKELILILNTTLFEFKDDFMGQIDTLPKFEKIIDNFFDVLFFYYHTHLLKSN